MIRLRNILIYSTIIASWFLLVTSCREEPIRKSVSLNSNWQTIANNDDNQISKLFTNTNFQNKDWLEVDIPHNWDDYGGYRRLRHGNRHGFAWYRKTFEVDKKAQKRYFLWFEGVGSYATVWVNGDSVGYHAGGRTTFTIDITDAINDNGENILTVRADHPSEIRDLPWVCGGCSPEWGFCEGSQPMGIFRPVHLIETNDVRIEPFGIHVWNDENISEKQAKLNIAIKLKNYSTSTTQPFLIEYQVFDTKENLIASTEENAFIPKGEIKKTLNNLNIDQPTLWSIEKAYLYTVKVNIYQNNQLIDSDEIEYGIRTIKWDILHAEATNRFYLNNKPVWINGTAEYEHMIGGSHAFHEEQIKARTDQFIAMGYNSFRDGHQPHNFRYHKVWDEEGILWWPQMSAHIWFDTPEFRENFKQRLADWVIERRNSPSIILWGLENESTLPENFAKECTELIRKLDPTASSQRLVTTCNGGSGTDWNVVQNWSGTYGGDPENYANELSKQLLNGEYGAWRSIDLHTEGEFQQNGILSEDRMNLLMESKIRLGEAASDKSCGQYHWLMASHDNPGRTQSGEGLRDIDRLGPVNYKGVFTIWGEPTDLFYLYRANYVSNKTEPMVYLVSHTWADRWTKPGIKNGIRVFSNCDEVKLYNSVNGKALASQQKGPIGTHFVFDNINIQSNVLKAEGYVDGKKVAEDIIIQNHLPKDEDIEKLAGNYKPLTNPNKNYLYRLNCGGEEFIDEDGNVWLADLPFQSKENYGSKSWTIEYPDMPAFYGSQRYTNAAIKGTNDWSLLQKFRYGRHKLKFYFPVPNGEYEIELFFVEPWYGIGGSLNCDDWRVFDIAVNNKTVINDFDIWEETGKNTLLKKTIQASATDGFIEISFPQVKSAQAVISAIAISTKNKDAKINTNRNELLSSSDASIKHWTDTGEKLFSNNKGTFVSLLPELYACDRLQFELKKSDQLVHFNLNDEAEVFIAIPENTTAPQVLDDFTILKSKITTTYNDEMIFKVYKRILPPDEYDLPQPSMDYPFLLFAKPVDGLDDPIDLRKTTTWQAEDGRWYSPAIITKHLGKDVVMTPNKYGSIDLKFEVGLASKYGLQFRFINLSGSEIDADIRIVSEDGRLMWKGVWTFPATPNKWKSYRNDTQTVINAGKYFIQITPKSNGPLYFDWIKVQ